MHSVRFDAKNNIVEVDVSGLKPTPAIVDRILDDIIAAARAAPSKPVVLTCWSAVDLDLDSAKRYGERMEELKPLIRAVVRYGDVGATTKAQVRTESMKHKISAKAHFFATREEALEAVRRGEVG